MLIKRVIAEGSRSRVLINDELATVQGLARIGPDLVQVYGQHEQQALLRTETHLAILDRYAGLEAALSEYRQAFRHAHELAPTPASDSNAATASATICSTWRAFG